MSEYPKMLYKPGVCEDHMLWGEPLAIGGEEGVMHRTVYDAVEEADAVADGWGKDAVAPDKPRRGRPPKEAVASGGETT